MKESVIEKYLIKRVKEVGAEIRKVKWIGRRGCPDRLVGFKGEPQGPYTFYYPEHSFVELKAPGKKPDPHQAREIKKLKELGFGVWVIDTKEKVDNFIYNYTGK